MKIVDSLHAHLFNSSNAAYRLAVNHQQHLDYSINLISNKLHDVSYHLEGVFIDRNKHDGLLMKKIKYTSLLKSLVSIKNHRPLDTHSLSSGSGRLSIYDSAESVLVMDIQRNARLEFSPVAYQHAALLSAEKGR